MKHVVRGSCLQHRYLLNSLLNLLLVRYRAIGLKQLLRNSKCFDVYSRAKLAPKQCA